MDVAFETLVPTNAKNSAFFLFVFSGLLIFLLCNTQWFIAELYASPARYLLTLKDHESWTYRDNEYQGVISGIEYSIKLEPGNPEFHSIKSKLLINRCLQWNKVDQWKEWQQCHVDAMDSIYSSIAVNSRSAYAWSNLLLIKFKLRQFDDDFYDALKKCRELGAHEFSINRTVLYVGLREWQKWQPEHVELFLESLFAVQAVSPVKAKTLADEAGQGSSYCLWTKSDPKRHYSCKLKWKKTKVGI